MKILKNKNQKGFTLIEAMVSMTIVVMAVMGPLSLIVNSINNIRQERNRIAAAFLAEEVVENFRAYRDSFVLACKDIKYTFSEDGGTIESALCDFGGANLGVDKVLLQVSGTNPRSIAWNLFLEDIDTILDSNLYIDNISFNDIRAPLDNKEYCMVLKYVKYSNSYGRYKCVPGGSNSDFRRTTKLTKITDSSLRIEVDVYFTPTRFVKVIDYIYER